MEGLITQYQLIPKQLIKNVINDLPAVIEKFLHFFTHKTQVYQPLLQEFKMLLCI